MPNSGYRLCSRFLSLSFSLGTFHAALGLSENSFWGREQLSASGSSRVPAGYKGIQLPSHWSIFPNSYFGGDWGIQAIGGFCAKAYMDYVVSSSRERVWLLATSAETEVLRNCGLPQ